MAENLIDKDNISIQQDISSCQLKIIEELITLINEF